MQGDTGDPLLCNGMLAGLASTPRIICGEDYAVFTSIPYHRDWIDSRLQQLPLDGSTVQPKDLEQAPTMSQGTLSTKSSPSATSDANNEGTTTKMKDGSASNVIPEIALMLTISIIAGIVFDL